MTLGGMTTLLTEVTKGFLVVADTSPVSGSFAGSRLRETEDYEDGTARLDVEWPGREMADLETSNLGKRSTPPPLKG